MHTGAPEVGQNAVSMARPRDQNVGPRAAELGPRDAERGTAHEEKLAEKEASGRLVQPPSSISEEVFTVFVGLISRRFGDNELHARVTPIG